MTTSRRLADLEARSEALHGQFSDEVIEVNREILRLRPGHMAATNRLGIALLSRGEKEEARRVFVTGVERDPNNRIAARRITEIDVVIPERKPRRRAAVKA